jgi:hypothetical protein
MNSEVTIILVYNETWVTLVGTGVSAKIYLLTRSMELGNYAEGLLPIYQVARRHMPWERRITVICVFLILPNSSRRKTNILVPFNFSPINIQQATLDGGGEMLVGLHVENHFCPVSVDSLK